MLKFWPFQTRCHYCNEKLTKDNFITRSIMLIKPKRKDSLGHTGHPYSSSMYTKEVKVCNKCVSSRNITKNSNRTSLIDVSVEKS